jgi:hypothetical protein
VPLADVTTERTRDGMPRSWDSPKRPYLDRGVTASGIGQELVVTTSCGVFGPSRLE